MRPVHKGNSPYDSISDYHKAAPFLEERIGSYCSYCELPLYHVPEVEHKVSKSKNPELQTTWENLLLGCKYCNSRKKDHIDLCNVKDYLWPDIDNTALAFTYRFGVPQINTTLLQELDDSGQTLQKAQNTFQLLKLDNPAPNDRRAKKRNEVYETAIRSLKCWKQNPINDMKEQIVETAIANGFFSIWTTVFIQEPEMLNAFIHAFVGTEHAFFNEEGTPRFVLTREQLTE